MALTLEEPWSGFGGKYYRPGYWCPASFPTRTGTSGYVDIDGNEYWVRGENGMPSSLPIILNSTPSNVKIGDTPEFLRNLNAVTPDEFLIGVEASIYDDFVKGFSNYTCAARIKTFKFDFDELYVYLGTGDFNPAATFEAVDAIFASEEMSLKMGTKTSQALKTWVLSGGNFAVTDIVPSESDFLSFKRRFADNPAIAKEAMTMARRNTWPAFYETMVPSRLAMFALLTAVTLIIALKIGKTWKNSATFASQAILILMLSGGFSFYAMDYFSQDNAFAARVDEIIISDFDQGTEARTGFVTFHPFISGAASLSFESGLTARRIFASERESAGARIKILYGMDSDLVTQSFEDMSIPEGGYAMFKYETHSEVASKFIFKQTKTSDGLAWRVFNESGSPLRRAFITDGEWAFPIGDLMPGDERSLKPEIAASSGSRRLETYIGETFDGHEKARVKYALGMAGDGGMKLIGWSAPRKMPVKTEGLLEWDFSDTLMIFKTDK